MDASNTRTGAEPISARRPALLFGRVICYTVTVKAAFVMVKSYDVIVLGLGAMGSAAVYQLATRGVRVLGIDRFSPPHAAGSTHGDTRITRQAIGEGHAYTPLALRSHIIWRAWKRRPGRSFMSRRVG